jgi:DNA-binding transcriptional LysR family regulator
VIDLRLLHSFVAVAEAEHVGRAAKTLHISQSPLSRQIRQLEEVLGLTLFHRERQRIRLTGDGRWLLEESRRLLSRATALERDALRRAHGERGRLRVGFVKSAMWTSVLPRALIRFRDSRPDVALELQAAHSADQQRRVLAGDLDLALLHERASAPDLEAIVLLSEPLFLALPARHPLAKARRVAAADLHGVDWVVLATRREPDARDAFVAACARAGFTPNLRFIVGDQTTAIGLVGAGMGCALLPRSASAGEREDVLLRPVPWMARSRTLYASWRPSAASPALLELVRHLEAESRLFAKTPRGRADAPRAGKRGM